MDEDDFTFIRNLKREHPAVNVSYVVNKCDVIPDDIKKYMGSTPSISLPVFDNAVFEAAGSDILYPQVKGNLSKLSELAGYGAMDEEEIGKEEETPEEPVKPEKVRKTATAKVHPKVNNVTVEIGVGGVCPGVGTTHTALMLAYSLAADYKVAVVEQNHPYDSFMDGHIHAFANIYRTLYPDTYVNSNVIPRFTYKGLDFYPYCNYAQFSARFRDDYDYVIVDYGNEMSDENFFRMGKRVVVASASEWKIGELERFVREVALKNDMVSSINYLMTFMPKNKMGQVRKICSAGGATANVYEIPVCPDWDEPTPEIGVIFNEIMTNSPQKKKKSFLGFRRK